MKNLSLSNNLNLLKHLLQAVNFHVSILSTRMDFQVEIYCHPQKIFRLLGSFSSFWQSVRNTLVFLLQSRNRCIASSIVNRSREEKKWRETETSLITRVQNASLILVQID